jgi:hypothetical protein
MCRKQIVWLATFLIAAACHSEEISGDPVGTLTIVSDGASGTSSGDTLVIGDWASFSLMGPDSIVPSEPVGWAVSDTTVVGIEYQNEWSITLRALRVGRATLTVNYQGESGTHDLVVRTLRASDTAVVEVQPVYVGPLTDTLGDTIMVAFNVFDARDNVVWGRPSTFSLSDSTVLQEDSLYNEHAMVYRAIKSGTTMVTLTCEGVHGSIRIIVP